jgi:hypothetical protein
MGAMNQRCHQQDALAALRVSLSPAAFRTRSEVPLLSTFNGRPSTVPVATEHRGIGSRESKGSIDHQLIAFRGKATVWMIY